MKFFINQELSLIRTARWLMLIAGLCLLYPVLSRSQTNRESTQSGVHGRVFRHPMPLNAASVLKPTMADTLASILLNAGQQMQITGLAVVVHVDDADILLDRYRACGLLVELSSFNRIAEVMALTEATILQIPADSVEISTVYFTPQKTETGNRHSGKIYTEFNIEVEYIDVVLGGVIGVSQLSAGSSAKTAVQSQRQALAKLQSKAALELLRIYDVSSDLTVVDGHHLQMDIGRASAVNPGMRFEIYNPDRRLRTQQRTVLRDGGPVAFATVVRSDSHKSVIKVDRQWRKLQADSWARLEQRYLSSWYLSLQPALDGNYAQYGIYWQDNPLADWNVGIGMTYIQVTDSYQQTAHGIGFGFLTTRRFINGRRLDLRVRGGFDLDIPFRKDDEGQNVSALMFSLHSAVTVEWALGYRTDLVCNIGYRFGKDADSWDYSSGEENYSAYWLDQAPAVNATGFFLSAGYRFALF